MPEPPAPTAQGWAVCPHLLLSRCVDGRARGAQPSLRDRDKGAKEGCPRSGHLAPVFRAPGSLSPGPLSSLLQALVTVSAHRAPPELPHGASTPHSVPTAAPPGDALSLPGPAGMDARGKDKPTPLCPGLLEPLGRSSTLGPSLLVDGALLWTSPCKWVQGAAPPKTLLSQHVSPSPPLSPPSLMSRPGVGSEAQDCRHSPGAAWVRELGWLVPKWRADCGAGRRGGFEGCGPQRLAGKNRTGLLALPPPPPTLTSPGPTPHRLTHSWPKDCRHVGGSEDTQILCTQRSPLSDPQGARIQ